MGRRHCIIVDCTRYAIRPTNHCIGHGGGSRCTTLGCLLGAQRSTKHCVRHGGGRQCMFVGCTRSTQGSTEHCIGHGGGRRCITMGCTRGAKSFSEHCKGHGGGRRCMFVGCTRSAVDQGCLCVGHGGGRRCTTTGCTRSAVGPTDNCKTHGGGRRCAITDCARSAQWPTGLCVEHHGGKRCSNLLAHPVSFGPPDTLYHADRAAGLCFGCHMHQLPEKHIWYPRREQLLVAEIQRRLSIELEKATTLVHDCPIQGSCAMVRPDLFYDFLQGWLSIECDEGGEAHTETANKYDTIYHGLANRRGLILRINPDGPQPLFVKGGLAGQGKAYSASMHFSSKMEMIEQKLKQMIGRILGAETWDGFEVVKLFF